MERKKIACIISDMRFEGQTQTVRGMLDGAEEAGFEVYLFTCDNTWGKDAPQGHALPLFHAADYDGILLHGDTIENRGLVEDLVMVQDLN